MGPVFPSAFEAVLFWVPLVVTVAVSGLWIARNRHPRGKRLHDAVPLIFLAAAAATVIGYARLVLQQQGEISSGVVAGQEAAAGPLSWLC
jgi:hypothetical protein